MASGSDCSMSAAAIDCGLPRSSRAGPAEETVHRRWSSTRTTWTLMPPKAAAIFCATASKNASRTPPSTPYR